MHLEFFNVWKSFLANALFSILNLNWIFLPIEFNGKSPILTALIQQKDGQCRVFEGLIAKSLHELGDEVEKELGGRMANPADGPFPHQAILEA